MQKRWRVASIIDKEIITKHPDINPVILQILNNREIVEKDYDYFLNPNKQELHDPFLFQDMEKVVGVIIKNIKAQKKILIYGDYDADGITSTALMYEVLKTLQAKVETYIPDRVSEGYGLNKKAIETFSKTGVDLIITVDNGIRNKEEVAFAQSLGLEVIVTDHHVFPPDKNGRPGTLIINPSHPEDNYPYKKLAGVGVAYKLASALISKSTLKRADKDKILEKELDLVAIGTIADLVPLTGENRILVHRGVKIINNSLSLFKKGRPGLRQLIRQANLKQDKALKAWNVAFQLGPRLNAASRLKHASTAFNLLTKSSKVEVRDLAQELDQRNQKRQMITESIFNEARQQVDKQGSDNQALIAVCPEGKNWNEGVIGLVAGKLSDKYYRPVLVITRIEEDDGTCSFKASGRSIDEFNLMEALESSAKYLDKYGGHPLACGFSIYSQDKLDKFIQVFIDFSKKKLKDKTLLPSLDIDMEIGINSWNLEMIRELEKLRPYGKDNPEPVFLSNNISVNEIVNMGVDNQHVKFKVQDFWALAFGQTKRYENIKVGDKVDIVYTVDINNFNNKKTVQFKIIDLKKIEENV